MIYPLNYQPLINWLAKSPLSNWGKTLPETLSHQLRPERWGDMADWQTALDELPNIKPSVVELHKKICIGEATAMDDSQGAQLQATLMKLHPWRKGPYELFGLCLDTEWRSDWKWDRVLPHLDSLQGRLVLDVGCGNGYHCWRMLGAGAKRVIGLDPSPKFVFQFQAIKHFVDQYDYPIDVLPLGIEHMPNKLQAFDSVFSMGVLYHRRSPMRHLQELRDLLRPGGQLILETLIIEGSECRVFVPEGRYAKMPNVWFIPSADTMLSWMRKQGLHNPQLVDVCATTVEEQRATAWMKLESLADFLDPQDCNKTIEGHAAPIRAVFIAEAR
ncbi:MAG: tRNA 5-methoxyuridine(34)/uridine 5-oxyacetic acid(34) synthase CmoB [Porticoccaceae bacterium]